MSRNFTVRLLIKTVTLASDLSKSVAPSLNLLALLYILYEGLLT